MNPSSFEKVKRDKLLDEASYQSFVAGREASIAFDQNLLATMMAQLDSDDGRHIDWRWGIASGSLQLLIGRYSAGTSVAPLALEFAPILAAIEATALPHEYCTEPFYLSELDTYAYAMWLLSLCKLLRLEPLLPRVVALFDVVREENRGKDALFEMLLDKLGMTSIPTRGMLKPGGAHPLLLRAIEAEPGQKARLVAEFLKKWYPSMKATYWHDRHRRAPQNFFGYWAFEAGLVTLLWEIDDSSYRDLPYYPKDLVDYARQQFRN